MAESRVVLTQLVTQTICGMVPTSTFVLVGAVGFEPTNLSLVSKVRSVAGECWKWPDVASSCGDCCREWPAWLDVCGRWLLVWLLGSSYRYERPLVISHRPS